MTGKARGWRVRTACVLAMIAATPFLTTAHADAATAAAQPAPARVNPVRAPLVMIGISGLTWNDVSATKTPRLWRTLSEGAAAGAATVRTINDPACVSGWLSLSAGRPAVGVQTGRSECGEPSEIIKTGEGSARIRAWPRLVKAQSRSEFSPEIGVLGQTFAGGKLKNPQATKPCATAVGPGAALALADRNGDVRHYKAAFDVKALGCAVTVVDGGQLGLGTARKNSLASVDQLIGRVIDTSGPQTNVLVQTISPQKGNKALGVSVLSGPASGTGKPELLSTSSTRWDGLVRLLDVPDTLLDAAGLAEPSEFSGAPITVTRERQPGATAMADRLRLVSERAQVLRRWWGVLLYILFFAGLGLAITAHVARRRAERGQPALRDKGRGLLTPVALMLGAAPAAAYLVTLTHWWRAPLPDLTLWTAMIAIAGVVAAVTRLITGARPPAWRAAGVLSLITFLILLADVMTGTILHRGSPLGPSILYGGRFYGFGNATFSIFSVITLVLAGAVAAELGKERRRIAVGAVVAIGALAVFVDIWPGLGTDVGGGIALVPGMTVLALGVAGIRLTLRRFALAGLAGVAVVAAAALADWARPASQRTHAGRFVQQLIDGDGWETVERKAGYAAESVGFNPVSWLTLALLTGAVLMLVRPEQYTPGFLNGALTEWTELRPVLSAVVTTVVLGGLVNDYGVRIAYIGFVALAPLVALACAAAASRPAPEPEPTAPARVP